jgi:hypothetical protein
MVDGPPSRGWAPPRPRPPPHPRTEMGRQIFHILGATGSIVQGPQETFEGKLPLNR